MVLQFLVFRGDCFAQKTKIKAFYAAFIKVSPDTSKFFSSRKYRMNYIPGRIIRNKEMKLKWVGSENFDICFCVIFDHHCQSFICGRETGHWTIFPFNFENF